MNTILDDPTINRWEESYSAWDYFYLLFIEIKYFFQDLSISNIKEYTVYFLDNFTINISVSFKHISINQHLKQMKNSF